MVDRLELFCDCKDSLNVVVTQLLNQVSNGGIVLKKKMEEKFTFATKHTVNTGCRV